MNRLRWLWNNLRSSFWFVPSLIVAASVVLAAGAIRFDLGSGGEYAENWPQLLGAGADGARGMMSTIAGSMITVVGVTFSMVLMVLALASTQYTSRILRNFVKSRVTQYVLGIFCAIFTYCLIVLRMIRSGDEGGFVPHISVFLGFALALFGVGALVYFIHHIAYSIQASKIIATISYETIHVIDRLYPARQEDAEPPAPQATRIAPPMAGGDWHDIPSHQTGYVQCVDMETLVRLARENRTVVRMNRGVGEFVVEGLPLLSVAMESKPADELEEGLRGAVAVSRQRTVEDDVGFGIRQIVDVALKALSPGVNDTTTAVICVDYLSSILARLSRRRMPGETYSTEDGGCVIIRGPSFRGLLGEAFDQIRRNARGEIAVLSRLLDGLEVLLDLTQDGDRRQAIGEQVQWVAEAAERTIAAPHELAEMRTRLARGGFRADAGVRT